MAPHVVPPPLTLPHPYRKPEAGASKGSPSTGCLSRSKSQEEPSWISETRHKLGDKEAYTEPAENPLFQAVSERVQQALVVDGFLAEKRHPLGQVMGYITTISAVIDIPRFFDLQVSSCRNEGMSCSFTDPTQPHDYTVASNGVRVSKFVRVRWLDPPGLFPGDIRTRHMHVKTLRNTPKNMDEKVIWRSLYDCNGACQRIATEDDEVEWEDCAKELERHARKLEAEVYPANKRQRAPNDGYSPSPPPPDKSTAQSHSCKAQIMVRFPYNVSVPMVTGPNHSGPNSQPAVFHHSNGLACPSRSATTIFEGVSAHSQSTPRRGVIDRYDEKPIEDL